MTDWLSYINITRNKRPRQLLVQALPEVKERGTALDLGSGALNDSRFLLSQGFSQVVAVDSAISELQAFELLDVSEELLSHFKFINSTIEDFDFLEAEYDLVNVQFVLPFIDQEKLSDILEKIKKSLKKDGIFVGQFFGVRDSWGDFLQVGVMTEEEAQKCLSDLEIIYFVEEEKNEETATKAIKHWHTFNFIVKKN